VGTKEEWEMERREEDEDPQEEIREAMAEGVGVEREKEGI
jgi:hypothetical protein